MGRVFVVQWNFVEGRCVLRERYIWAAREDNEIRNETKRMAKTILTMASAKQPHNIHSQHNLNRYTANFLQYQNETSRNEMR